MPSATNPLNLQHLIVSAPQDPAFQLRLAAVLLELEQLLATSAPTPPQVPGDLEPVDEEEPATRVWKPPVTSLAEPLDDECTYVMSSFPDEVGALDDRETERYELTEMLRRATQQLGDPVTIEALHRQVKRLESPEAPVHKKPTSRATSEASPVATPEQIEHQLTASLDAHRRLELLHCLADLYEQRADLAEARRVLQLLHDLDNEDGRTLQRLCDISDRLGTSCTAKPAGLSLRTEPAVVGNAVVGNAVVDGDAGAAQMTITLKSKRARRWFGKIQLGAVFVCAVLALGSVVLSKVSAARNVQAGRIMVRSPTSQAVHEAPTLPAGNGRVPSVPEALSGKELGSSQPAVPTPKVDQNPAVARGVRKTATDTTLERHAVDAAAAGDFGKAASLYQTLAQQRPTEKVFAIAASIMNAKAAGKDAAKP